MADHEKRETIYSIGKALEAAGFQVFGMHADRSDLMTDYYAPAYWDGVAKFGAFVVFVGSSSVWRSGYPIHATTTTEEGPCQHCKGTGIDPSGWTLAKARANPTAYHRDTSPAGCVPMFAGVVSPIPFCDGTNLSCRARGCRDGVIVTTNTKQVGSYPTSCILNRMPRGQQWSVQCDGVEVAKGGRIDERTAARIIAACSQPPKTTVGEYTIKAASAAADVDEFQNMAIG